MNAITGRKTKSKTKRAYYNMIKNLERFKKLSSSLIVVLMGIGCLATLIVYCYHFYLIWSQIWFISRSYITTTSVVDFETVTVTNVQYFLYKNLTAGARNADGSNGFTYIVPNISETCNGNGTYEALNDLSLAQTIQQNLSSNYMKASEIFVLLMMLLTAFLACIYIPFSINEYGTPIYFRDSFSNVFLDFLRLRIFAFAYFMAMSGCLPHFSFYITDPDHHCLFAKKLSIA